MIECKHVCTKVVLLTCMKRLWFVLFAKSVLLDSVELSLHELVSAIDDVSYIL